MNWKRKCQLPLTVAFVTLFSAVGTAAAAEPMGMDVPPAAMIDNESETPEEAETESKIEDETKKETEEVEKTEEEEETEEENKSKTEEENGDETESETKEETDKDNLPEDSDDEAPVEPEEPDGKLSAELTACVHDHNWSMDWIYDESCHWHECGAEDCPVTDNSGKDGYEKHSYGEDNVCTVCGYFKQEIGPARAAREAVPTYQGAYEAMIALKKTYPEGMEWTNFTPYGSNGTLGTAYTWKGGAIYGGKSGVGCAAFAFILSDAAFGSLPARAVTRGSFTFEDVKVGDILRVNGNSHSVIVLQKSAAGVIIAEANYNKSVHWGRVMTEAEVLAADYMITRYPVNYVPSDAPDADVVAHSGTEGNLSWSLTNAGVLTISGSGAIPDYSPNDSIFPSWNGYSVNTIVIKEGVTGIGDYAFYGSSALSIYIPNGVMKIGQSAFCNASLMSVTIPGTVGTIGNDAFNNCTNLTSVTVSEGVKIIGERAFRACTSLTHIDFPASITSVGAGAFASCSKMTRVRFMPGSGTAALGDNLFSQCWELTSVTLPQTADCISAGMFENCLKLPELYIPASVTNIADDAFHTCNSLKYIYFGGSEAEWNRMVDAALKGSLQSTGTTVKFDVPFENPFAQDPNDPGDLLPDETDDESKNDNIPTTSSPADSGDTPGSAGNSGGISQSDGVSSLEWPLGEIQKQDERFKFTDQLTYSKMLTDSESESADAKGPSPQEPKESESALDDLTQRDKSKDQQASDEDAEAENSSRSGVAGIGIIVPVLAVPAAGFVLIRKRIIRKK